MLVGWRIGGGDEISAVDCGSEVGRKEGGLEAERDEVECERKKEKERKELPSRGGSVLMEEWREREAMRSAIA